MPGLSRYAQVLDNSRLGSSWGKWLFRASHTPFFGVHVGQSHTPSITFQCNDFNGATDTISGQIAALVFNVDFTEVILHMRRIAPSIGHIPWDRGGVSIVTLAGGSRRFRMRFGFGFGRW